MARSFFLLAHDEDHIQAILQGLSDAAISAHVGNAPVFLIVPASALYFSSPTLYMTYYQEAAGKFPKAKVNLVADCGNDAGLALKAMEAEFKLVALQGDHQLINNASDVALMHKAKILTKMPAAFDPAKHEDFHAAIATYLSGDGGEVPA